MKNGCFSSQCEMVARRFTLLKSLLRSPKNVLKDEAWAPHVRDILKVQTLNEDGRLYRVAIYSEVSATVRKR